MQSWAEKTIRNAVWEWASAHSSQIAVAIAVLLLVMMVVSTVMNILTKHKPMLMIAACVVGIVAWKCLPKQVPPPKPVAQSGGIKLPDITLPDITLPDVKLPTVTLPKFDWAGLWDKMGRRALDLQAEAERRKREEEARRLAEDEAERKRRLLAKRERDRIRKEKIRRYNEFWGNVVEAEIFAEGQQAMAAEAARERQQQIYFQRMMGGAR